MNNSTPNSCLNSYAFLQVKNLTQWFHKIKFEGMSRQRQLVGTRLLEDNCLEMCATPQKFEMGYLFC